MNALQPAPDWPRAIPRTAVAGALAWLAWVAWVGAPAMVDHEGLFLLAPLVLVPLALPHVLPGDRNGRPPRLHGFVRVAVLPAALLVAASFLWPAGPVAAALALPWLALTLALAIAGVRRFAGRGAGPVEELLVDAGLASLPVGGLWLLASRAGLPFMDFHEPFVLLTAVHFHYASFLAPVLGALAGRVALPARPRLEHAFRALAAGLVGGPLLLALGITFSPALELASALLLAGSLIALAAFVLAAVVPTWRAPASGKALLAASALCVLVSMSAAVAYAFGEFTGRLTVDLATMGRVHGAVNAYGLALLGLLAYARWPPAARAPRGGIPFSRLRSRRHTGADYFERASAVDARAEPPTGLVDDLGTYRHAGLDPDRVHPAVRAFYERTCDHSLLVVPRWTRGFRTLGRLYHAYATHAGQMRLPLRAPPRGELIRSRILAVRDDKDGRQNVRAWVRTYAASGSPVYVAAYATHVEREVPYMNIAFPFPGWNLTSILRLARIDGGASDGVLLTTFATSQTWGDQGVYAARDGRALRLPINETIRVWTPDMTGVPFAPLAADGPEVTVLARHEIHVFGFHALTLDYHIFPLPTAAAATPTGIAG